MSSTLTDWLLVTTKSLIIKQKDEILKINIEDVENFEFMNRTVLEMRVIDTKKFKSAREIKKWMFSGNFKIINKDATENIVYLNSHNFGFFMYHAIIKLRFVVRKYEVT